MVAAAGAGGAGTVLAARLGKLFTRHQDKQVEVTVDGKVKTLHDDSPKGVGLIIKALEISKEELDW
ncbi:hypothetical protein [Amycolatopsis sp. cmx-11-12]|uniref:hypothetical protein n=1 Tax=Amycolatopsis sp. cmx-11-12 TaxID=2785795 RepID=UPI003918178F